LLFYIIASCCGVVLIVNHLNTDKKQDPWKKEDSCEGQQPQKGKQTSNLLNLTKRLPCLNF
jgi:hypothetical protein